MNFNIDIHCHPTTKPFMSNLDDALKTDPFVKFNHQIESVIMQLLKKILEKKSEVLFATQSNFDNLFRGGHRIVFASITPMERAFFVANASRKPDIVADAFIFEQGVFAGTVKPKLINALMGFSIKNIEFVRNSTGLQNYFSQGLDPEYNYLKKFHNKKSPSEGYTLKLVNSFKEIEDGMKAGGNNLYVVLSIEGAHALRTVVPNTTDIRTAQGAVHDLTERLEDHGAFLQNINAIKKWKFVPLFVTLMHHFWNGLGGHARSLNKTVGEMLNQEEGINQGLSIGGRDAIEQLLSTKNGVRILIDIKHMSVASRREYYQMLDTHPSLKGQAIPIICSHTGMAGNIDTLNDLAKIKDKAEETNLANYFHRAQINLCFEDIRRIVSSRGLIGIQLDEKRIAGAGFVKEKFKGGLNTNELNNACAELVMSNVFMIIRAVAKAERENAWNVCSIGSDYDGLINHLDPFTTSEKMTVLRDEVEFYLDNLHAVKEPQTGKTIFTVAEMKELMMGQTAKQVCDKLFSDNAFNFLKRNFNR